MLLELYRFESRTIAQLAKALHTSIPSTTALIDELTDEQWVQEMGIGITTSGRKPALFRLNRDRYVNVIVDISLHDTKLAVFNLANCLIRRFDVPLPLEDTPAFLEALQEPLAEASQFIRAQSLNVIGLGVSLPGLVNPKTKINHTYQTLNTAEQSLFELVSNYFSAPLFLLNDTKATILGEHRFGLAQEQNNVLSINIDWGVGLGVIINGEVLQGADGFAGELGHIQVKPDGELCRCGKVGCLDTLASASSLIHRLKAGLQEGRVSKLAQEPADSINIEKVIHQANQGDGFAIDLLSAIGHELGKGLTIAVHLFNPETIIINGVLAKADRLITRPIEQAIDKYCLTNFRDNLTIRISQLGEMARLQGTQAYVMQRLLEEDYIPWNRPYPTIPANQD